MKLLGRPLGGLQAWWQQLVARPAFQSWAASFFPTRRLVRRDGEKIFDLLAGYCHTQLLFALAELDVFRLLLGRACSAADLAAYCDLEIDDMALLLDGGVALGLLSKKHDEYVLARLGVAVSGVPGVQEIIRHNIIHYRDLSDPLAMLRHQKETELSQFWPYVFSAEAARDDEVAGRYSRLMADTQALVAADTIAAWRPAAGKSILDVGGGHGVFLNALAHSKAACAKLGVFDLPAVISSARAPLSGLLAAGQVDGFPGSFKDDSLPKGFDVITLIRVLYDHDDDTVGSLLTKIHAALPSGGQLVVSEPMRGEDKPERAGDIYFALYCRAMKTGQARKPSAIATMLIKAGFAEPKLLRSRRPFVTSVMVTEKVSGT